ncbi:MAG: quinone-dependent dihydroorotate dehydrogenase [Alphaproteobacteria bacterium]|nr:quinone-dependent dihydroorotate dehydrogenase [Alphaproteobacteria bacterium]MCB9974137.1 quinone-dependent dihydroorotate dehydrogenase [Rhodospirillales bacterium]
MLGLYRLARPVLFKLEPEKAHRMTLKIMKSGLMPMPPRFKAEELEQEIWGLTFPNPVGLAAGFDKNAEVIAPALSLGFGLVEVGTVTPRPQAGNPQPRIFRDVESGSIINRMGFPNDGLTLFEENYDRFKSEDVPPPGVVGINIGMNKDQKNPVEDYTTLIKAFAKKADYLTVNISSPNTPGLRDLQEPETLRSFLADIINRLNMSSGDYPPPPLLVKLSPDLSGEQQEQIAAVLLQSGVSGIVLTNTTIARPEALPESFRAQPGGLSGPYLRKASTEMIRNFYRLTNGKLPIIGVGGVSSGKHAYEKIKAGASLVQLYTGFVYRGPDAAYQICRELLAYMRRDGITKIGNAVGLDHKKSNGGAEHAA